MIYCLIQLKLGRMIAAIRKDSVFTGAQESSHLIPGRAGSVLGKRLGIGHV